MPASIIMMRGGAGVKNPYMNAQVQNMLSITESFKQSLKIAAMQDDSKIDRSEARMLRKLEAEADKFARVLKAATEQ